MELKMKYQTSYFIYPYVIKEEHYLRYITRMLGKKEINLKLFNKKKDTDLYEYFLPEIIRLAFPSFGIYEDQRKRLNKMDRKLKAKVLSELPCISFEYELRQETQAKAGEEDGIFFKINKIEIICFSTGICFLVLKTNIEETDKFADLLDFNYKFKEINSELNELKAYENIRLQENTFKDIKKLSELIKDITGDMEQTKKTNIDINKFLVYSYICLDQEYWSNEEDFKKIENEFYKYVNILPSTFNSRFDNEQIQSVNLGKYIKIGITKMGMNMITSSMNTFNYTRLPNDYENQYLYTYILSLYKSFYLKNLQKELREKINIQKTKKKFREFTTCFLSLEMTNDDNGNLLTKKIEQAIELDKIYQLVKKDYDLEHKNENIDKNIKLNKVLIGVLSLSLIFNVINFIILMKNM